MLSQFTSTVFSKWTGNTAPVQDSAETYEPLATLAPEQSTTAQDPENAEMGFGDVYDKPEGRNGDALAQFIAFVSGLFAQMERILSNGPLGIHRGMPCSF